MARTDSYKYYLVLTATALVAIRSWRLARTSLTALEHRTRMRYCTWPGSTLRKELRLYLAFQHVAKDLKMPLQQFSVLLIALVIRRQYHQAGAGAQHLLNLNIRAIWTKEQKDRSRGVRPHLLPDIDHPRWSCVWANHQSPRIVCHNALYPAAQDSPLPKGCFASAPVVSIQCTRPDEEPERKLFQLVKSAQRTMSYTAVVSKFGKKKDNRTQDRYDLEIIKKSRNFTSSHCSDSISNWAKAYVVVRQPCLTSASFYHHYSINHIQSKTLLYYHTSHRFSNYSILLPH